MIIEPQTCLSADRSTKTQRNIKNFVNLCALGAFVVQTTK